MGTFIGGNVFYSWGICVEELMVGPAAKGLGKIGCAPGLIRRPPFGVFGGVSVTKGEGASGCFFHPGNVVSPKWSRKKAGGPRGSNTGGGTGAFC